MKRFLLIGLLCTTSAFINGQTKNEVEEEANQVIERFSKGLVPFDVDFSLKKDALGHDSYSTEVSDGTLYVKGSSGVALCHAFYKYVKSKGSGICSWSGTRITTPTMNDQPLETVVSPYRDHYYLNVVTYGYTMPFWNQERWDQELDWMALHGIDMPLMLVANEAISRRVFKRIGLTDAELDEYFVGPAHLPWMRMGNISGASFDGSLSEEWHDSQIQLAHHILDRMKLLGMKPICPAFGGFVPKSIKNHYPSVVLDETTWSGSYHNWRLDPEEDLFHTIGTYFIEEWEKEFGPCKYYLSDSFNEMAIPSDVNKLTSYGTKIYQSISDVNPDAVWVMQGWMLGYQRNNWNNQTLPALLKNVPDDKMMILDMATDYNKHFWYNGYDWDFFNGFYNKEWVWSVIPNMGGKTAPTGILEYYANGRLDALRSAHKGNLVGYGFAPEGIENNEIIYELLTDGGWTTESIDLDEWIRNYAECRYGLYTSEMETYFNKMRQSVYGSFTDHPRFSWQFRPSASVSGSVNVGPTLFEAVESLMNNVDLAKDNSLLTADIVEAVSIYASGKIQYLIQVIDQMLLDGNVSQAKEKIVVLHDLMMHLDAVLTKHPLFRLERWEDMAKNSANGNTVLQKQYVRNARRLVSIWEPKDAVVVRDYAAKVWSGLIRDYYWPRWEMYFKNKIEGKSESIVDFENSWVNNLSPLSSPLPVENTLQACVDLFHEAKNAITSEVKPVEDFIASTDEESHWYVIRSAYENMANYVLTDPGEEGKALQGSIGTMSGRQMWRFISLGNGYYRIEGRYGRNISSNASLAPVVSSQMKDIKMQIRKEENLEWNILPGTQNSVGLHLATPGNVVLWSANDDIRGSRWVIEDVEESMVPEVTGEDYKLLLDSLERMRKMVGPQIGQVKSDELLDIAIDTVKKWSTNIIHQSYNDFLKKRSTLLQSLLRKPMEKVLLGNYAIQVIRPTDESEAFLIYDKDGRLSVSDHFDFRSGRIRVSQGQNTGLLISNYEGFYMDSSLSFASQNENEGQNLKLLISDEDYTENSLVTMTLEENIPTKEPYIFKALVPEGKFIVNKSCTFPLSSFEGYKFLSLNTDEVMKPLIDLLDEAYALDKLYDDAEYKSAITEAENALNNLDATKETIENACLALQKATDELLETVGIDQVLNNTVFTLDMLNRIPVFDLSGMRIQPNKMVPGTVYILCIGGKSLKFRY